MRPIREYERTCPTCDGKGFLVVLTKPHLCPKCKGERIIPNPIRLGGQGGTGTQRGPVSRVA